MTRWRKKKYLYANNCSWGALKYEKKRRIDLLNEDCCCIHTSIIEVFSLSTSHFNGHLNGHPFHTVRIWTIHQTPDKWQVSVVSSMWKILKHSWFQHIVNDCSGFETCCKHCYCKSCMKRLDVLYRVKRWSQFCFKSGADFFLISIKHFSLVSFKLFLLDCSRILILALLIYSEYIMFPKMKEM